MRIYCDTNSFREELHQLRRNGIVELVIFPYDSKINKKKYRLARPSAATWADLNLKWTEANFPWRDAVKSDKYEHIRKLLGRPRLDALHIDSAFKAGCRALLTRDKNHILAKTPELEELLGMRFFHPDEQWDDFLMFVGA